MTLKEIIAKVWDRTKSKIEPLEKVYQSQYLTLEGSFSTNNSEEWSITINDKEYTPTTRDFKIVLDSPLVLTPTTFTDKYSRLILPKGTTVIADMSNVFSNMTNIKLLDISGVDWSNATNMSGAFVGFPKDAELIGTETFYTTGNVTNFANHGIFEYDPDIYVNFHSITTFNSNIFNGHDEHIPLGKYDLSGMKNFNTFKARFPNVKCDFKGTNIKPIDAYEMFTGATDEQFLNIQDIDMSECTNLGHIFWKYKGEVPDISQWNTSKCRDLENIFKESTLTNEVLNLNWDTSKVTVMYSLFLNAKGVKVVNIPWDTTSLLKGPVYMLKNSDVEEVNFGPNFDLSNKGIYEGWANCGEFWDTPKLKRIRGNFKWQKTIQWGEIKSKLLDRESAIVLLNALPEITDARDCHIYIDVYNKLTEEDLAIATTKGWNIVQATSGY